ncbi:hypothetical protein BaRGS_00005772 [Batillaria attramentaria]|uniref:Uncharacterized protein n=1 Tax=Batillaria attramentaria TaxID=370345 RepID=A0ABD0LVM9_9CAEN
MTLVTTVSQSPGREVAGDQQTAFSGECDSTLGRAPVSRRQVSHSREGPMWEARRLFIGWTLSIVGGPVTVVTADDACGAVWKFAV